MLARLAALAVAVVISAAALVIFGAASPAVDAAASIGSPVTSSNVNERAEPIDARVEFSGDNNGVWVSFAYQDLPPGSRLSRIVRFNGEDFNWDGDTHGRLNCCPNGGSGRFAFLVVRLNGQEGQLPGGAYEARVYLNDAEVGYVGFGIKGTGGNDRGGTRDVPGGDGLGGAGGGDNGGDNGGDDNDDND